MKNAELSSPAVREALERITASSGFVRADRAAQLLRYVVEETASGRGGELKEYAVALAVFKRNDYDPRVDSLVRVEFGKLRRLLAGYYESEGRDDQVRIEIPKGAYVPVIREADGRARSWVRPAVLAGAVLSLSLAAGFLWWFGRALPNHPPSGALNLAVLPFADLSNSQDQRALCDGLTEEVIEALNQEGLRVAARTSVAQYRNRESDVRTIGQELNVQAVLEGSVRKEEDHLRITAQLIDSVDGFHLWSKTWERLAGNVLTLEQEISEDIVRSFREELAKTRRSLVRQRSDNPEAWRRYLDAARYLGAGEAYKAAELYRAAVSADPGYTLAWVGLANSLTLAADWRQARPAEVLPQAAKAAESAIALDPSWPETQQAWGRVRVLAVHDWAGAERAFLRAIELDPTYLQGPIDYARLVLVPRGRFREAVEQLERVVALDPKNTEARNELAATFVKAGQYEQAVPHLELSRKLVPSAPAVWVFSGIAAMARGQAEEGLREFQTAADLHRSSWTLAHVGFALARLGRREEAEKVIVQLQDMSARAAADYEIARVCVALEDRERAFAALDRALADLSPQMLWLRVDPLLEGLRGDPRFTTMVKRMRLE